MQTRSEVRKQDEQRKSVGLRIHTHGPIDARWVHEVVAPVWRSAYAGGRRFVVVRRGWLHGPHVDVFAVPPAPTDAPWPGLAREVVVPQVEPGTEQVTPASYLDAARERGRLENVPGPYLPLMPHGRVELLGQQDVAGRHEALDLLRNRTHAVLAPALLGSVAEAASDEAAVATRVIEVLAAVADLHPLGMGFGAYSMRSHAEAFCAWVAPRHDLRRLFQQRYQSEGLAVRAAVEQRRESAASPSAARWAGGLAYSAGRLDAAVQAGSVTAQDLAAVTARDTRRAGPPGAAEQGPQGDRPATAFHEAVHSSGLVDDPSDWFVGYRLLINFVYELFPLLGVSPVQRAFACYAVAEAIDEVLQETWQERLHASRLDVGVS